jgi:dsRNA-specific ribonuclease
MTSQYQKSKWRQNPNEPQNVVVYNEHNHSLTASSIHQIWSRYSRSPIAVDDRILGLFRMAVTHRSYVRSIVWGEGAKRKKGDLIVAHPDRLRRREGTMELQEESYDRLELVGDSIFHCVLTKYLFNRFPTQDEGFLTRLRAKIEGGDSMAAIAKKLRLEQWVVLSAEQEAEGKRTDDKILEDVFEALMGAMFLSFGYPKCEEIILNICHRDIDFPTLLQNDSNFKDQLLRRNHRAHIPDPTYGCRQEDDKSFTAWVNDAQGRPIGYGNAKSKPKAEQLAARRVLEKLNLIGNDGEAYMNTRDLDVLLKDASQNQEEYADANIEYAGTRKANDKRERVTTVDARVAKRKSDKNLESESELDTGSENESEHSDSSDSNSDSDSVSESDSDVDAITAKTSKQRDTRVQNHAQNLKRRVADSKKSKRKNESSSSSDESDSDSSSSSESEPEPPSRKRSVPVKKKQQVKNSKTSKRAVSDSDTDDSSSEEEKKKPVMRSKTSRKGKKQAESSSESD